MGGIDVGADPYVLPAFACCVQIQGTMRHHRDTLILFAVGEGCMEGYSGYWGKVERE